MKMLLLIVFWTNSLILGSEIHAKKLSTALSTDSRSLV
jgi:hypothetical protein